MTKNEISVIMPHHVYVKKISHFYHAVLLQSAVSIVYATGTSVTSLSLSSSHVSIVICQSDEM